MGREDVSVLLDQAIRHMEEANEIMAFEAKGTFYGDLAATAKKELVEMQQEKDNSSRSSS